METIVSSRQEKIQFFLENRSPNSSIAIKHVHDLKLSYENPIYLAHSSRHKTFAHQVV
jgi:hypothetical protein